MITPLYTIEDLNAAITAHQIAYATYHQACSTGINLRQARIDWVEAKRRTAAINAQLFKQRCEVAYATT